MAASIRLGGIFLRARDPKALYAWYQQHLALEQVEGAFAFPAPAPETQVLFSLFKHEDSYLPPHQQAMLNFQVDDLEAVLTAVAEAGAIVDPKRDRYDFGSFGWFADPEGNRVELWEPSKES